MLVSVLGGTQSWTYCEYRKCEKNCIYNLLNVNFLLKGFFWEILGIMHGVMKAWMLLSQLLNQMYGTRPPPLAKDKIVLGILKEN
jgi:hypothetical protein